MIRVLLVDDHTLFREGIRSLLESQPDIKVISEAEDGHRGVKLAIELEPDVVLMDIAMPLLNGLDAACKIKQKKPEIQILILSMHDSEEYIRKALAIGALGYILKDETSNELIEAVRSVHRGEIVLSPAITNLVVLNYLRWGNSQIQDSTECLSLREREVLQLIAEGHTNKEIAEILCISIKTVQAHRTKLMKKLDLHDKGELIKFAIQKKIIEI
ncbi:MAG: response regulator [Anaerolineales bacterium]